MNKLEAQNGQATQRTDYRSQAEIKKSPGIVRAAPKLARSFSSDDPASPERRASQLRLFLENHGAPYSCFALYLSSRVDLLPAEFCREFELTPDDAPPVNPEEIQQSVEQQLGRRIELIFPRLDLTPFRSTLIAQYHLAELSNGVPVVVAIARREFRAAQNEVEIQQLLDKRLLQDNCPELVAGNTLADFLAALVRKVDFNFQAEKLELLSRDSASFEGLEAPRVYKEFSSNRVLTLAWPPDKSLDRVPTSNPFTADKLATLICKVWLQQALFGRCFPVDPQYSSITVSDRGHIGFSGCDLVSLPKRTQINLWNYLLATNKDEPDQAAMFLLREMSRRTGGRVDSESFRSSFRQAAYFGALEPVLGTDTNALAQLIFQHWKTAIAHDHTAEIALLSFYRGLFSVARVARKISPDGDPLRYALEELRTTKIVQQLQEFVDLRFLSQNIDKFVNAAARMPRAIDDVLSRASQPDDGDSSNDKSSRGRHRERDRRAILLVFSLLVATVASQSIIAHPWASKLALLAFMLTGLLVLKGLKD